MRNCGYSPHRLKVSLFPTGPFRNPNLLKIIPGEKAHDWTMQPQIHQFLHLREGGRRPKQLLRCEAFRRNNTVGQNALADPLPAQQN